MPLVYVFLGARGSGRREVVLDLIKFGLDRGSEHAVVLLPDGEAANPLDAQFDAQPNAQALPWNPTAGPLTVPDLPEAAGYVFMILDGQADPVDQLERLRDWLAEHRDVELARIVTVLHSQLASTQPSLHLWFEALVHFSDIVLFSRREDVSNKWFRDFEQRFKKECYPVHFEFVKGAHVRNPAEVLYPEPRRLSQAFDFEEDDAVVDYSTVAQTIEETEIGGEAYDADDDVDAVELNDLEEEEAVEDPYFVRDNSGRRARHLPDIRPFLEG